MSLVGSMPDDDTPGTSPSAEVLSGSGLVWHLREATRIARFDPDAIARTAQHRRALFYGAGFLSLGIVGALLSDTLVSPADPESAEVPAWARVLVAALIIVPLQLLLSAFNVAVIHGAARLFFDGHGRYIALLRVLWVASVVQWLAIVPVIGTLAGGGWFLLIVLVTLEEVEGIERLQGLLLVVVLAGLLFFVTSLLA
jgi:hypothetical protein